MNLVVRLVINAVAIWLAAQWVDGIAIASSGRGREWDIIVFLVIAAIFTIVNALVKPLVQLFSLPLLIVSLGLFTLVINALMLLLTAYISRATSYGLTIDKFSTAFWAAIVISLVNFVLGALVPNRR